MVDWERLEKRPVNSIYSISGQVCQSCQKWNVLWYSTKLLDEKMEKLANTPQTNKSFWYHFCKTRKRAEEIQKNGKIKFQNMAGS